MNKPYKMRGLLAGCAMTLLVSYSSAQELSLINDSMTVAGETVMPGRLFNTTKINNTSASSKVSGEQLNKTVDPNLGHTLAGQLPGLMIRQSNGIPGNDTPQWLIRGIGSYGSSECKLYVDGFEVNSEYLIYLIPDEIESVTVLKDAASLAMFGMRGANGVIWIETKRGKIGKPTISARIRGSLQNAINIHKPLNSYDFASLYNQAVSNDNGMAWNPYYSSEQLSAYKNFESPNVDWYDQVLRNNGSYIDANVSFNGGNETARYNIIVGYSNQEGLLKTDRGDDSMSNLKMDKFNLRTNFDFSMFDIFEARIDLGGRLENRKGPNFDTDDLMNNLASYPSNIYNVYDNEALGYYSGTSLYPDNPVASVKGLGWNSSRLRILQGNFSLKEKLDFITEGLYLQEAISFYSGSTSTYDKTRNYARYQNGEQTTTDETTSLVAGGYGSGGMNDWKQVIMTLGYDNAFGKHAIQAAANFHLSDFKGDGRFGYKYHYLNYNGRVNYTYDNRYTGEVALSYFGSDSYAPGNRFGFYPAVSAAWVISNEEFLKNNRTVNFLKLRASAGKTGGSDSEETNNLNSFHSNGRYLYQQYYIYTGGFNSGNSTPYQWNEALSPLFMANKNAFAEKSLKYNVGVDATLWNKLGITVDAFLDKRSQILTYDQTVMGYYGWVYYLSNIGKMTNKGLEVSATFKDKVGDVGYSLFGMASYAKNKLDFFGEVPKAYSYNASTGRPLGSVIGLVADGFYQLSDFNADGSLKEGLPVSSYGKVQPGDIKYKDLDNDGYIDDTDMTKIGDPNYPKLHYSFGGDVNYKGFDFSIMFRGSYGASVNLMDFDNQFVAFIDNRNAYDIAKGAWAYYPEQGIDTRRTATYPRLTAQNNENNYQTSSFWIRNNDFLRIQYIELGYNFTNQLLKAKGLSNLRLFINATNPVTWSNLLKDYNMDPESYYGYPALKSYTVGVSLTL